LYNNLQNILASQYLDFFVLKLGRLGPLNKGPLTAPEGLLLFPVSVSFSLFLECSPSGFPCSEPFYLFSPASSKRIILNQSFLCKKRTS
jgi:hypothetical protein